jgi:hypothetical protein
VFARATEAVLARALGAVLALGLAACGGGNSSSSQTTQTAQPVLPESSGASASALPVTAYGTSHHHHHRHHHHPANGTNGEGPGAGAGAGAGTSVAAVNAAASGRPSAGAWPCDDAQFAQDQQQFASGSLHGDQEVDVCGTVTKVFRSRTTYSGLHGYYDLQVAAGDVIEIVCDLGQMDAPAWPWVKAGDYSYVQGRYYYDDASSQGIDWTHHGTSGSWPTAGYVVINGTEYQ